MKINPPPRISDKWGKGHYGAPRGDRTHKGIDLLCYPGSGIHSSCAGMVTKLGYPYANDLSYRYIQISFVQDGKQYDVRYFYVKPTVVVGNHIDAGDFIGYSQDLDKRYPGIGNHIHVECKVDGSYIEPVEFI